MSPEQHLAIAEQLLDAESINPANGLLQFDGNRVQAAIGHALVALAVEAGVPHGRQPQQQVPDDSTR